MYKINFNQPCHVHFIGIGGISMSGLAEILLKESFTVSGSDNRESALTQHLTQHGAQVFIGQKASNIIPGIDVVVYTAAIREDNEEFQEAVRQNIPMMSRAELLGQLMTNYDMPIAVAGTHGKTTTTSMLSHVLMSGDLNPTISVGGILKAIGGNIRVGGSDVFVTEACEYTNSFLNFLPKIGIILNVDADHLDFFKDLDDIRNSFHRFAQVLPQDGTLIINGEIDHLEDIIADLDCNVLTFGMDPSFNYSATNISYDEHSNATFQVVRNGEPAGMATLSVGGEHNIYNALSTIAVADLLGIDWSLVQDGLLAFTGTDRRFQYKGVANGVTIIDDYAHHPTEIEATLKTAARYPHKDLWVIFQPHTYTRTQSLFNEFAEILSKAKHLILADIYAAREVNTLGISSEQLADAIKEYGTDVIYLPDFATIEEYVKEHCKEGDLLITMGAGDVVNIGENLLKAE